MPRQSCTGYQSAKRGASRAGDTHQGGAARDLGRGAALAIAVVGDDGQLGDLRSVRVPSWAVPSWARGAGSQLARTDNLHTNAHQSSEQAASAARCLARGTAT